MYDQDDLDKVDSTIQRVRTELDTLRRKEWHDKSEKFRMEQEILLMLEIRRAILKAMKRN